ncbi:MAG: ankyrin repeat domain-containing protein [Rubrivivax sp.]|nr:ankyrin repeat domain-containing protein [Rubrivivax sp.]
MCDLRARSGGALPNGRRRFALAAGLLPLWALHPDAAADPREDFFKGIELDRPGLVQSALAGGLDPNTADDQGRTGLLLALRAGAFEVAAVLLAAPGIEVDRTSVRGETPVMLAALRGELQWMERLVSRGAAVNRSGWTPLHYAASGPQPKSLDWLLDRGAEVDARSPNGTTALMMAAGYGAIDGVDVLLGRGADPAARNHAGLNAADFARRAGREAVAARLLRAVR